MIPAHWTRAIEKLTALLVEREGITEAEARSRAIASATAVAARLQTLRTNNDAAA